MNTRVFCLCVAVALSVYLHNTVSLEAIGCHGTTVTLRCDSNSVIYIDNIYALAKKTTTNCPTSCTVGNGGPKCTHGSEDCKMSYTGESVTTYHERCSGRHICEGPITSQATTCSRKDFSSQSNYMLFKYQCIAISDITSFSEHKQIRGKAVSIWNVWYPDSGIANNADNVCSVTASCSTSIVVSALDLNLTHNASGRCQQQMVIVDGPIHRFTIDCNNNSYYRASTLYTSRSHFVRVHLIIDNNSPTKAGRFWVQFHASNHNAIIEIGCGTSASTSAPHAPVCPETTTTTTTPTSPTLLQRGTPVAVHQSADDTLNPGVIAGVVISVLVCVMLLLIATRIVCRRVLKNNKMKVANKDGGLLDSEFAVALGITSTAPAASLYPSKPRRLTPVGVPQKGFTSGGTGNVPWSTISSMAPTASIIKHMSSAVGKTNNHIKSPQPASIKTNVFVITREVMGQQGKVTSNNIKHNLEKWRSSKNVKTN